MLALGRPSRWSAAAALARKPACRRGLVGDEHDRAPRQRRVLAKLVSRRAGTTRGTFEFADGRVVEVDGATDFKSTDAPRVGDKALIVMDQDGQVLRWEPYAGARLRRPVQ